MKVQTLSFPNIDSLNDYIKKEQGNLRHFNCCLAFSGPDFDAGSALNSLSELNIDTIGCTTAGEIVDDNIFENSMSLMLLNLPENSFHAAYYATDKSDLNEIGQQIAELAKEKFDRSSILVYIGGLGTDGESLVGGIKSKSPANIEIFGGMGADNFRMQSVEVFFKDKAHPSGIAVLILDADKVKTSGKTFSGWNELGIEHQITKSEGNNLYEIDGKPALQMFKRYFSDILFERTSEDLFQFAGIYPLKINNDNGTHTLRSILMMNEKTQALILAGGVEEGAKFKFCPTPNLSVVDTTIDQFAEFAKDKDPDAVILNSCAGRHLAFGPMFEEEIERIYALWQKPSIGLMSYGEIGNSESGKECEFHNVSCAAVTLTFDN